MNPLSQHIRISNQAFHVGRMIASSGSLRWYEAKFGDEQPCFIGQISVQAQLNVEQLLTGLPAALKIDNPYVQTLLAAGHCGGKPGEIHFAVSEPPDQPTLRIEVDHGSIPEARVRSVLIQLTKAIAARSGCPFAFGCLAPDYILTFDNDNIKMMNPWIMWLLETERRANTTGNISWEYTWQAPECVQQKDIADTISDCHCACALAFAMLTGTTHVDADSALIIDPSIGSNKLPDVRDHRPDCSLAIAALIKRGLHPDRRLRLQSPGQLLAVLKALPPLSFHPALVEKQLGNSAPKAIPPPLAKHSNGSPTEETNGHQIQARQSIAPRIRRSSSTRHWFNGRKMSIIILANVIVLFTIVIAAVSYKLARPMAESTKKKLSDSIPSGNQFSALSAAANPEKPASEIRKPEKSDHKQVSASMLGLPTPKPSSPINTRHIILTPENGSGSDQQKTWVRAENREGMRFWESISLQQKNWPQQRQDLEGLANYESITFTFQAEAGVPYYYWVRGRSIKMRNKTTADAIFIRFDTPVQWSASPYLGGMSPIWPGLARIDGFGEFGRRGWAWVSALAIHGFRGENDLHQRSVVFTQPGQQSLSIFIDEGPLRISHILISQTQDTRPHMNYAIRGSN